MQNFVEGFEYADRESGVIVKITKITEYNVVYEAIEGPEKGNRQILNKTAFDTYFNLYKQIIELVEA